MINIQSIFVINAVDVLWIIKLYMIQNGQRCNFFFGTKNQTLGLMLAGQALCPSLSYIPSPKCGIKTASQKLFDSFPSSPCFLSSQAVNTFAVPYPARHWSQVLLGSGLHEMLREARLALVSRTSSEVCRRQLRTAFAMLSDHFHFLSKIL